MSKAFTSEENEDEEWGQSPPLPLGIRHYMTPRGAEKLRSEAERLTIERRGLAADLESKSRAQVIDRRLRFLIPRLEQMEVVDPLGQPRDRVLFGATVTLEEGPGKSERWRIVGIDEMDLDRGEISWMSPLASALLEKKIGDTISFMGRRLTISDITYHG